MAIIYGENDASDNFEGTDFRDIIYGGAPFSPYFDTGEDTIDAEDGADDIFGGDGDDELNGGDGDDHVVGGPGNDLLTGGDDEDRLFGNLGNDILRGGDENDYLDGHEGADVLEGGNGNDTINADAGQSDQVNGELGTDTLFFYVGSFDDGVEIDLSDPTVEEETSDGTSIISVERLIFSGGAGEDTATGGALDDELNGARSGDTLRGDDGDDALFGGKGADALKGGDDDDQLIGGGGADNFIFGDNDGDDVIEDFQGGVDTIDLTTVDDVDSFGDLDLTDLGSSVRVDYGTGTFVLDGVSSVSAVDADDFIFA